MFNKIKVFSHGEVYEQTFKENIAIPHIGFHVTIKGMGWHVEVKKVLLDYSTGTILIN